MVYDRRVGSTVRKAVLAYFADRADDSGRGIWCSKATIAAEVECSRSTVIKTINEFVEEGLISPVGSRAHTNGATVEYDMNLSKIAALPPVKEPVRQPDQSDSWTSPTDDQSDSRTPPVRQPDGKTSDSRTQTVHKPSLNHSPNGEYGGPPPDDAAIAIGLFNASADRVGWSRVQKISHPRRRAVIARLKDVDGLAGWRDALAKAEASDFLCNRADRDFALTFDWLIKPANFIKLMEGNYDNRTRNPNAGRSPGTGTAAAFATVALERSHGRH